MDQLFRLRDTVVDYLSPLAKRRRTVGPATATPVKESGHALLIPASEPQGRRKRAAVYVKDEYHVRSNIRNPRKRARAEFEGEASGLSPDDSVSQMDFSEQENGSSQEGTDLDGSDEQRIVEQLNVESMSLEEDEVKVEEVDEDAVAQARVEEYLERQAELAMRKEEIERARAAGDWHADELFLYERLTMRSYEELIPLSWEIDFPTLPEVIFTDDPQKMFINHNYNSSSQGVKALQELLRLGVLVRDKESLGLEPESLIEREINRYIKYTEKDGGYHRKRFLPVISVVKARPQQEVNSITKAISTEMMFLAQKHRENLGYQVDDTSEPDANKRTPPLLYGMIVARAVVIFVTLDSADPNATLRHLNHFDFTVKKMDVWNGFAIALMAICARNYTMALKDDLEDDDEPMSDPDL